MEISFRTRTLPGTIRLLLLLTLIAALVVPAYAALTGDIEGTVTDKSGAVVSEATVKVKNANTGVVRTLTTNSLGQFAALLLELGNYEITVEKGGFRTTQRTAEVRSAEKTRVDISLEVGAPGEVVQVEGGATPLLDVATSQVSTSIDAKTYVAIPSQNRDPVAFANLAPGVVPVTNDNPFLGSGSFNSNGSRGRANNITVDNVVATDISTTGSSGTGTFSLDQVQEFKLITNTFDAEYGRNSGAQVQIITKGGTNSYHGTAYWFHQNGSVFNARDWFNPDCAVPPDPDDTSCGRPTPLIRNLGGFTAGGPVFKNRTFLFGHWEILRIRGAGSSRTGNVLTPAEVAGITDSTSLALFNRVGAPQSPTGLLSGAAPNAENQNSWSIRVDQILRGGKDTLTARYGQNPVESISPGLTFIHTDLPNFGASVVATDRVFTFSYTSPFTANVVNQFRFNYGRSNPFFTPTTTLSEPFGPEIQISGKSFLGVWQGIPQGRTQNTYQYGNTTSFTSGRHSWKFGGDVFRYLAPSVFDAALRGVVTFGSVAAFQAGTPTAFTKRVGSSDRHNKSLDHFWFVQDDWRVTDTFTVNLGFRLESSGGVSEENDILANLNRTSTAPLGGGGAGVLGSLDLGGQSFERTWNSAPRFGFAWNPGRGKWVVRGGYGIAYDFIFLNPITNLRFSAPFMPTFSVVSGQFTGGNTYAALVAGTSQAEADAIAAIGTFPANQANFGNISPVNQQLKNPRNQQMTLGIEYSLARDFVLKATGIHTKNDYLQASIPLNLLRPGAMVAPAVSEADENARLTALRGAFTGQTGNATGTIVNNRIDTRFNAVTQVNSIASSNFNALQLQAVKRFGHGFTFDTSYTWGHSIDNTSDVLGVLVNDVAGIQDPRDLRLNRGNSQFDIRHRWVMSYVYEIPFTKGLQGIANRIFDGWGFSGIIDVRSGFGATVFAGQRRAVSDNLLVGGGTNTVRANWNGADFIPVPSDPNGTSPIGPFGPVCARGVNTSTSAATTCTNTINFPFTQPLLGNPGNMGRNSLRLDGYKNVDFAVLKNTKITEGTQLQFRWEVYNLFNTSNLDRKSVV